MTEGEAWTAEVLAELRAARFTPLAWARFLARSFARARETRRTRPREHRQVLLLGAAGLAAWGGLALAGRPWLALAGAGWWLLVCLMVDWHLGMLDGLDRLGLANTLSLLRAGVVPVLPVLSPALLAAVLIPTGISDGIDGPIARARGETTRLGLWLDGGVDGFLLGAAAVGAARDGVLPVWAAALVIAKHALQWLVVAVAYFAGAEAPAREGFVSGKAPGLVLFAGLALAALHVPGAAVLVLVGVLGGLATFGLTVVRTAEAAR